MKTRNIILVTALVMGVTALTSCGGRGNKSGNTSKTEGEEVAATAVEEQTKAPERQARIPGRARNPTSTVSTRPSTIIFTAR